MLHSELRLLTEELTARLCSKPATLQRITQTQHLSWIFSFRVNAHSHYLFLRRATNISYCYLALEKSCTGKIPSPFTMSMRKHLGGSKLVSIDLSSSDRILFLRFLRHNSGEKNESPDRSPSSYFLIVELIPHRFSLVLANACDSDASSVGSIIAVAPALQAKRRLVPNSPYTTPHVIFAPDRPPRWNLHAVPIGYRSEVIQRELGKLEDTHKLQSKKAQLSRHFKSLYKRLNRRAKAVEVDLERAKRAERYKQYGTLLLTVRHNPPTQGTDHIEVINYYDNELPLQSIPLKPEISLQSNIERYFSEYRRLHDAYGKIEDRLLDTQVLLETVEKWDRAIANVTTTADLDKLLDSIKTTSKEILPRESSVKPKTFQKTRSPYHEYTTCSGYPVLVGKSAKDNDTLTVSIARGRDIWLHAHNFTGSHIVIRVPKSQEPIYSVDLMEAAFLAAWFSKGKKEAIVDVIWTHAKYVRKSSGMPPGQVHISNGKILTVRTDDPKFRSILQSKRTKC